MNYTQIRVFTLAALAAAGVFAADNAKATPAKTAAPAAKTSKQSKAAATASTLPAGLPKGAKPMSQLYYWRYVDKAGKAWIYHTTPFGLVHNEEQESDRVAEKPDPTPVPGDLTVVDKGDSYQFTRNSPFGPSRWTVKKSRMTEQDKVNLEQTKANAAAAVIAPRDAAALKASVSTSLPPDAKPMSQPYYWRYVDKTGKAWIYHQTPFGFVHNEETAADRGPEQPDTSPTPGELTVVDKGDSYEFTRASPFGPGHWTVKKSQMTAQDKVYLEQAKAKASSTASVNQSQ